MRNDGGDDVFIHYNDLDSAGVVYPRVGLSLSFSVLDKDGKPRAFNVRAIH
ncbi:cold-shock protein [Bradyrhizobium sp. McL0616]|uniref:cold-shock protein n=1 Tax=Bradyrhizobium sp. McL0616 TaxID=3415674 RepID=UPI003CEDF0CA